MDPAFTIGLDFGTESARALLVDVAGGQIVASATFAYPHGVIDEALPGSGHKLPPDWALQDPTDWLEGVTTLVQAVRVQAGVDPRAIVGIGVDFTSCTILPTTVDGAPLCTLPRFQDEPYAWPELWKHHAAQAQADRMTTLASDFGEPWLERYGGRISSEWLVPKALATLEGAPEVYAAAGRILEAGDWIVWQLSGREKRNACAAGYKACWGKGSGYPSRDFLRALNPGLVDLVDEKLSTDIVLQGQRAGTLTPAWADRLGLTTDTAVGVAMIDAHAGALGVGLSGPGTLAIIMGTSTCHLLVDHERRPVRGIAGVVEDGILPGLFAYEGGQASVGDVFAWFIENGIPPAYQEEAGRREISLHTLLSEKARSSRAGESGLLALDWWNGCRTPLVDADLSGAVLGYTISSRPEEVYRALIEATAFGTRLVIETFEQQGLRIERLAAAGGLTRNPLLMQIYADVTGRGIVVSSTEQATALGAAILGATAAGPEHGGYRGLGEAIAHMAGQPSATYQPEPEAAGTYDVLYGEYLRLVDFFGRADSPLKVLRRIRGEVTHAPD